jgi:hypothetical protein
MHDTTPTNIGIVIGNGKSRQGIRLTQSIFKNYNNIVTYGCNDIYKEFMPDVLITVDERAINRIEKTHLNELITPSKLKTCFPKCSNISVSSDSGTCAICISHLYNNHDVIFLLGFDYSMIYDNEINNMYRSEFDKNGELFTDMSLAEAYIKYINSNKFVRVVDNKYCKNSNYPIKTITKEDFLKITF